MTACYLGTEGCTVVGGHTPARISECRVPGDRPWDPEAELRTAREWGEFLAWVQAEPPPVRDDESPVIPRGFDLTWEAGGGYNDGRVGRYRLGLYHRSDERHPDHPAAGLAGHWVYPDNWPDVVHQAITFARTVTPRE